MAGKQADVTLKIKARNEAEAALQKTVAVLQESAKALEDFNAASKKQNRTTAELRVEQEKLNKALAELSNAKNGQAALNTLQKQADELKVRLKAAREELSRLTKETGSNAGKSEAQIDKQSKALARQLETVRKLSVEQKALNATIAAAPVNPNGQASRLERSVGKASTGIGSQIAGREAAVAARQAAIEEARKVNSASKFGVLLEKEVALRKQAITATQQEAAAIQKAASAQSRMNSEAAKGAASKRSSAGRSGGLDKNSEFKIQRTSLDIAQRLRGQVLSLTAGYVGLFGVINQVNLALEEQKKFVGIQAKLASAFQTRDFAVIGKEMDFVREQADRLGINFLRLADSYGSFAAAAKLSGASNEEVRTVFVRLSESVRGLNLDTEATQRIFKATEQIFSKAKVTSEELRQQLGDSLPGAVAEFANSMEVSGEQLDKMLQKGEVKASDFVNFVVDYAKKQSAGLDATLDGLSANMERFGNATRDLRSDFAQGLERGLIDALKELSESFKDPAVRASIRDLGESIGDLLKWLAKYRSEIAAVVSAVAGFYAFKMAGQLVLGFGKDIGKTTGFLTSLPSKISGAISSLAALEAVLFGTSIATEALSGALGLLVAGGAGYAFGVWLRNNFAWARKLGVGLTEAAVSTELLARRLSGDLTAEEFAVELEKAYGILDDMYTDAGKSAEEIAAEQAKIADQAERSKVAAEAEARAREEIVALLSAARRESEDSSKAIKSAVAEDQLDDEGKKVEEVREKYDGLIKERQKSINQLADASRGDPSFDLAGERQAAASDIFAAERQRNDEIAAIRQEFRDKEGKKVDAANNERLQKEKQLRDLLKGLEESALQTTADTLDERLALIQRKYAESAAELANSGADASEKLRIQALLDEAQAFELAAERKKDATDKVTEAEKKLNDAIAARDAYIQTVGAKVTAGALSQAEATDLIKQKYDETKIKVIELAAAVEAAALKAGTLTEAQRQGLEQIKIEAQGASDAQQKLGITLAEVQEGIASGMTDALDSFISSTMSAKEAAQEFFSSLLRDIARAIIQQQILNLLQSFGGGAGGGAGVMHSGGVVGNASGNRTRRVSPTTFIGAPRYHSGGLAGLSPNEVPAILERGEEVLTKSDPRHAANGGAAPAAASQTPQNIQVINTIDTGAMQQAVLTGPNAAKQIVNIVRANKGAFKQALT